MSNRLSTYIATFIFLVGVNAYAQAPPEPPPPLPTEEGQKGVEVLTRGPVHEAFATPTMANPKPNPIIDEKPPAPVEELPPDQKPEGDNVEWISGYYAYDEATDDYIWISGFWRAAPPGRDWVPGHWREVEGGYQWVAGYWVLKAQPEVEYLPPPPATIDNGPAVEAPDTDHIYAPGCWVYQTNRYLWRPGFWYRANPNWFYSPAHYVWSPAGYVFVDGYWDYPVVTRGLLFAPVRFAPQVVVAGWQYQPRYVIGVQGMLGSLFARPGYGRYYFGDYYSAGFASQGFVAWFDYRIGRAPDPFFQSARWRYRNEAQWENNLRTVHRARLADTAPRPPVTLVQQRQVINNITNNKTVVIGGKNVKIDNSQTVINQLSVSQPLTKIDNKEIKLQTVSKTAQTEQAQVARQRQAAAVERQKREAKVVSDGGTPTKPTDKPARIKIETPKGTTPPAKRNPVKLPTQPTFPKVDEKPVPKVETVDPDRIVRPKVKTPPPKKVDPTPPPKKIDPTPPPKKKDPPKEKGKD